MASETIPGGAYKVGDAWVNARGEPLEPAQVAEAERLQSEQQAQRDEQERQRLAQEAASNPLTRMLSGLQPQRSAEPAPKREGR